MKYLKCIFLLFWAMQINVFSQTPCDGVDVALVKIDKLVEDGNYDKALDALNKIKNDPQVRNCDNMEKVNAKIEELQGKWHSSFEEMYDSGEDVFYGESGNVEYDAEAVKRYLRAAEQGDADAQYHLGVIYGNGYGVQQSDAEAVKWYRKAAEQGHPYAQNDLGYLYQNGFGVERNEAEAFRLYHLAAEQGDAIGQFNLGLMYEYGCGVQKNMRKARKWYVEAATQGYEDAIVKLERHNRYRRPFPHPLRRSLHHHPFFF